MIARLTTYEGQVSPNLDGVRMYDESAIPWLEDAEGFRGLLVLVDRANRRTLSLSFWENEETERQSEEARRRFGELVAEHVKREEGEAYEVVLGRGLDIHGLQADA